jgi:uncharacterized protein (DUF1499 family)
MGLGNLRHEDSKWSYRLSAIGFALSIFSAFVAVLSGFGTRWHFWNFSTGFKILRWATYAGITSVFLSGAGLTLSFFHRGRKLSYSMFGILLGFLVVYMPLAWWHTAKKVPAIHDITTDTGNPPKFLAVPALRKDSPNSTEYGGPQISSMQHEAYPDIKPMVLPIGSAKAFEKALSSAKRMGWDIIDANANEGRIEATDTTFWFGFKDDVVVRLTPMENSSTRIDVRSVSRVGKSDIGTNAKRIRKYMVLLSE